MKASRFDKYHLIFIIIGILIGALTAYTILNTRYSQQIQSLEQDIQTLDTKIQEQIEEITKLNTSLIEATQNPQNIPTLEPITIVFETSKGEIVLELYPENAPITVDNFVTYIEQGFFENLVFHRVIRDFMIQSGGFYANGTYKEPIADPIVCESNNGLYNSRGTIAMARTSQPNSATSQFFINLVDNPSLDYPSFDGYGYAVFGKVIEGMDIIDGIANQETAPKFTPYGTFEDWPTENVTIISAYTRK